MRTTALLLATLVVGTTLIALAPGASAFAWCTAYGPKDRCDDHLVCVGRSTGQYPWQEECTLGVEHIDCVTRPCILPPP